MFGSENPPSASVMELSRPPKAETDTPDTPTLSDAAARRAPNPIARAAPPFTTTTCPWTVPPWWEIRSLTPLSVSDGWRDVSKPA